MSPDPCNSPARNSIILLFGALLTFPFPSPAFQVQLNSSGTLSWTNAVVPGICTLETSASPAEGWSPVRNLYSVTPAGTVEVPMDSDGRFYRVRAVDVSGTPEGFTNFIQAYGVLETLAGDGFSRVDNTSFWKPEFEGGAGSSASLSRPHFAMADRTGRIYIADKNSHSVLRLDRDGTIHTHAGTHVAGFNGEGPAAATSLQLYAPNALWVRGDGTVYVLDTDNGRVRRVDTNGVATTLFKAKADGTSLAGGRMLWVSDDESLAYFGNETRIRCWTPSGGVQTFASSFQELGTFCVEANGDLIAADRGGHYVYRISGTTGEMTAIAGNGQTSGGGDGFPALQTALNGPRGVWPVPTGGYLILLHDGSQLWYLDTSNVVRLLLDGGGGTTHGGDGEYFYDPAALKISEGRSVTMDYEGNIVLCESDYGYVRRIRFERWKP